MALGSQSEQRAQVHEEIRSFDANASSLKSWGWSIHIGVTLSMGRGWKTPWHAKPRQQYYPQCVRSDSDNWRSLATTVIPPISRSVESSFGWPILGTDKESSKREEARKEVEIVRGNDEFIYAACIDDSDEWIERGWASINGCVKRKSSDKGICQVKALPMNATIEAWSRWSHWQAEGTLVFHDPLNRYSR